MQYAKTHLSALLAAVEAGEEVVIARGDKDVARLVPVPSRGDRELGFVAYRVPDSFYAELPEDMVVGWEGGR